MSAPAAPAPIEERERRVALAFIDAACLLAADGRGAPTEVHFAEDMAVWLLAVDWATASGLVRERLQHLVSAGKEAVRASIADRLPTKAEREAAYLVASAAIYRDDHFAHRQARALVDLAGILGLDRASVDRLSTNDLRPLWALYPMHWRLAPASPAGTINQALEAWAEREGLLADPRAAAALRALDLESFQRLTFPRCADTGALLWAAKYTLWLYFFDDVVERSTAKGDRRIDRFRARGGAAFAGYADMLRQVLHGLAAWQLQSRRYVNRHTVVLSDGKHKNPDIDADRVEMLRQLTVPPIF